MKNSVLLITLSGPDRPGIVHEVATAVHTHGGNWERSRLIHLSGRFVGLLQVSVEDGSRDALRKGLMAIDGLDLTVAEGEENPVAAGTLFNVSLVGADYPGIVREVFGAAAEMGFNVESMSTRTEAAADSGTLLFRADARLSSPKPLPQSAVQDKLEAIAQDFLVEVSVSESP